METYRRRALSGFTVGQQFVQRHPKGPHVRGEGELALFQALDGVPVEQEALTSHPVLLPKAYADLSQQYSVESITHQNTGLSPSSRTR